MLKSMVSKRIGIISLIVGLSAIASCVFVWKWLSMPRQSSVRLMYKLRLKELGSAIERYQSSHGRIPEDLEELKSAGWISDFSDLEEFEYIRGARGILAFRREPFRRVRKGEPWGGAGEVVKYEIPAARLVLFADGSIKFVDESDFQRQYEWLLVQTKSE